MDFNINISILQSRLKAITGKIKSGGKNDIGLLKKSKAGSRTSIITTLFFRSLGKYSYNHEDILGLEISPHYIRICQMKNSYGRWILNQLASSCMENQFTNMDIQLNQDLYAESLRDLLHSHRIKTTNVALSVPTSVSVIKIINMPDMEDEDLAQAASMGAIWESMVQLSGSINEYSVYYKVLRRKIKPSTSLSMKEAVSTQSSALDSLFGSGGNETSSFGDSQISTFTGPEVSTFSGPEVTAPIVDQAPSTIISSLPESDVNLPEIPAAVIPEVVAVEALPEEDANSMDVLFVATKLADIHLYTDIAKKAGLEPIIIDAKCNAIKHSFETNPEKHHISHPYAFLEFGADENYIYIVENMRVTTFNINISESDKPLITRSVDNIEALQSFIRNYSEQLNAILDNYTKQNPTGNKVYNIYVSSNTPLHVEDASLEPLINVFIKQMSDVMGGYKITPCNFCNHFEVPAEFAKKVNAEGNLSAWATVLGLATYKLDAFDYNKSGMAIDRVNLMPGYLARIKGHVVQVLSTLAMAAVFIFIMIISGASFMMLSVHGRTLVNEIKTLEYVKGEYEGKNSELQKLSMVMDKVKSLDKVRSTLPSNQMQILTVYKNMTKAIPEGVWLSDINFNPPHAVEIKGNSINDQNILEFVKRLNESGGFKKVSLKTMEALEKKDKAAAATIGAMSPVKKFTLQAELGVDVGTEKLELISGGVK